jgi:N-acetylmuramoyl-L-alanine amidase
VLAETVRCFSGGIFVKEPFDIFQGLEPKQEAYDYVMSLMPEKEVTPIFEDTKEGESMKTGIDPGHGGRDPGAIGPTNLYEKNVTLPISLEVARQLKQEGLETFLTREDDRTMEPVTRTALINNMKCDLAISIHCNSSPRAEANYISTFIQATGGEAEKLAQKVQAKLVQATSWSDGGVRVDNLHMTRETKMPAILVECGFISNPEQEQQLRQSEVQKKLAGAIVDGVLAYLGIKRKEEEPLEEVKVRIGDKEVTGLLIQLPGEVNATTYVPIRDYNEAMVEAIKAAVDEVIWCKDTRTVEVK